MSELGGSKAESLYEVAEELSIHPDIRIVGSIARSAIMRTQLGSVRPSGSFRNLNLLHVTENNYFDYGGSRLSYKGICISTRFDQWIRTDDEATWLTFPAKPNDVRVRLDNPREVLRPYGVKSKNGYTLTTLSPEVICEINNLMLIQRPKDSGMFEAFDQYVAANPSGFDRELLRPFSVFKRQMRKQLAYRGKGALRNIYHRSVPETTRETISFSSAIPWIVPLYSGSSNAYAPPDLCNPDK